jgi:ankyrin repeat protein
MTEINTPTHLTILDLPLGTERKILDPVKMKLNRIERESKRYYCMGLYEDHMDLMPKAFNHDLGMILQPDLYDNHVDPIIEACLNHDIKDVDYLLQIGSDPNVFDYDEKYSPFRLGEPGRYALSYACEYENYGIAKLLISHGAKPDLDNKKNVWSPLMFACENDNIKLVELLLSAGAYVNILTDENTSPLFFAAMHNNTEMIKLLLDRGANAVNTRSEGDYAGSGHENYSPLDFARKHGNQEIIQLFLECLKIK